MPPLKDLSGQRFGRFIIIERDFETQKKKKSREVFWKCQCDCGKIFSGRGHDISQGKIKSCGCLKKENAHNLNFKDLKGQSFGKLTVLYQCEYCVDGHVVWCCACACGNIVNVMGKHLISGATQSCGCLKSQGELKISTLLQELNIEYQIQKSFKECQDKLPLKFDFYLPQYNLIIEYHGRQHYEPIAHFGGEERFKLQQKHDEIKKDWCLQNNIKYLEISYKDFKNLSKEFLLNKIEGEN